jgi:hypothetical protein
MDSITGVGVGSGLLVLKKQEKRKYLLERRLNVIVHAI